MAYQDMTHKELVALCKQRKLPWSRRDPNGKVNPKTGKPSCNALPKAALVAALEAYDNATGGTAPITLAQPNPTPATPPTQVESTEPPKEQTEQPAAPTKARPKPKPEKPQTMVVAAQEIVKVVEDWKKLLSEFQVDPPQIRLISTVSSLPSIKEGVEYVTNYYKLCNNPDKECIAEKLKSAEARDLIKRTQALKWRSTNERLEIYFGPPGAGKTFAASLAYPNADVVVSDPSMTPSELFTGFTFKEKPDGSGSYPVFVGSAVADAMKNGTPVILDEMNLLSRECLRTLQAVTDNKPKVKVGTTTIDIKPGFKVVATINLTVDGQVESIPTPVVDRAAVAKEVVMDAQSMANILETYFKQTA